MVRTGDRCVRVGGSKSSAKKGGGGSASNSSSTPKSKGSSSKSNSSIGGNPVCPRETPEWQKPITSFFVRKDHHETSNGKIAEVEESSLSGSSKSEELHRVDTDKGNLVEMTHNGYSIDAISAVVEDSQENKLLDENKTPNGLDSVEPGTSSPVRTSEENNTDNTYGNGSMCKTPTSEKKRKSAINILTPKRIQSKS